jgi:hypothetical protein
VKERYSAEKKCPVAAGLAFTVKPGGVAFYSALSARNSKKEED